MRTTRIAALTSRGMRSLRLRQAGLALPRASLLRDVGNRNSTKIGKDRHSPTMGRYSRCSKITSRIGKKLDVGASVIKNHKIENETIGCRFRSHQAQLRKPSNTKLERITRGSK